MGGQVGCEVMKEGEVAMELFIVMSGEVLMQRAGQDVATLRLGECFGEAEMLGRGMGVHGNLRGAAHAPPPPRALHFPGPNSTSSARAGCMLVLLLCARTS